MTNQQKKNLARRRANRRRTLVPCKSNAEAIEMQNKIQQAIPDKNERQEYIATLIDDLIVTCDNCEERLRCDRRYEDCQYNPANGG